MIGNERQLGLAERKLRDLEAAIASTDDSSRESLERFHAQLRRDTQLYRAIKSGAITSFLVESLDDVAAALIHARVARGWTQRVLAEHIGVSEQMVQKDEAGGYENASLSRLADVAQALGYSLTGNLAPAHQQTRATTSPAP